MTCLLLLGPCSSSMRALSGRPSVLRQTSTLSTEGSKGYVRRAPPWMFSVEARASAEGLSSWNRRLAVRLAVAGGGLRRAATTVWLLLAGCGWS